MSPSLAHPDRSIKPQLVVVVACFNLLERRLPASVVAGWMPASVGVRIGRVLVGLSSGSTRPPVLIMGLGLGRGFGVVLVRLSAACLASA